MKRLVAGVALVAWLGCGFDSKGAGAASQMGTSESGDDLSTSSSSATTLTTVDGPGDTTTTSENTSSSEESSSSHDVSSGDTSGLESTTGESGSTDEGHSGPRPCASIHEIVVLAEDALLTGDWTLEMSELGEGMYAYPNGNELNGYGGTATFPVDVPCADEWYVWTRFYDWGMQDSWYIRVDGQPGAKEAIFEGDCTSGGNNWSWAVLNYREPTAPGCQYLHNPWIMDWDPGEHTVELEIRETASVARLIVVNDPNFTP
jgi:hypothetical protein